MSAISTENHCFLSPVCFLIILSVPLCLRLDLGMPAELHHYLFCASARLLWFVRSLLESYSGFLFAPHCVTIIAKPVTSVNVFLCQDPSEGFENMTLITSGSSFFFLSFAICWFCRRCCCSQHPESHFFFFYFPIGSPGVFLSPVLVFPCLVPSGFNLTNLSRHILLC